MLSIFTTTKDFIGEFDNIQQNAINSWRSLSDEIEIMIMGRAHGAEEMAKKQMRYISLMSHCQNLVCQPCQECLIKHSCHLNII